MFKILLLFCVVGTIIKSLHGADFFESLGSRLMCYPEEQEGCNKNLIDEYPDVAWSVTNLTKAETFFYLFTRKNVDIPELLHKCAGDLPPNSNFDPECRTEIFVPGFLSGVCNMAVYRELKNERLKCGCYNVILVDWMWGNSLDLKVAKENLRIVAKQIAIVVRNLKEKYNLPDDKFICTGHSYGAHICAYASQEERVGIINGLEVSGIPFSEQTPIEDRLSPDDADCVQVTHCNAGGCLPSYLGVNFTCGTLDFWFNGGQYQPACYLQILKSFLKGDFIYALLTLYPAFCYHFQCLQYYKASMCPPDERCDFRAAECGSNAQFQMGQCRDCGQNGENCAVTGAYACDCYREGQANKSFYLNTGLNCPFCDKFGIRRNGFTCSEIQTV